MHPAFLAAAFSDRSNAGISLKIVHSMETITVLAEGGE
jgi:hypothetical protein